MEECTKGDINRIKSLDLVNSHGLMAENTLANGKMGNKKEKGNILMNLDRSRKEFGQMANLFNETKYFK